MDYEKLCMNCFRELNGRKVCPHCGYERDSEIDFDMLPPGAEIADRFLIGRARGQDDKGIVYNILDMKRNVRRRMREYFPASICQRLPDGSVQPLPGHEAEFDSELNTLRLNAENSDEGEKKYTFVKMNGTGYFIERKVKSASLDARAPEPDYETEKSKTPLILILMCAVIIIVVVSSIIFIKSCSPRNDDMVGADLTVSNMPSKEPTDEPLFNPTVKAATPTASPSAIPTKIVPIEQDWALLPGGDSVPSAPNYSSKPTADPYNGWGDDYDGWGFHFNTTTPTPESASHLVNKNSPKSDIQNLQWQLIELGWLDASIPNGVYDAATVQAVKDFQRYMNDAFSAGLKVDGICGAQTFRFLNNYKIAQKPTPTATATEQPEEAVLNETSEPFEIYNLQKALTERGWFEENANGVYNEKTKYAVMSFQHYVNYLNGKEILAATGYADGLTQWFLSHDIYSKPTATVTPSPSPSVMPSVDPYDQTDLMELLTDRAMVEVIADSASIYDRPSQNGNVVYIVPKGYMCTGIAVSPDWMMIANNNGGIGYVKKASMRIVEETSEDNGGITPESSSELIKRLQEVLCEHGWLADGQADGIYGNATRAAVSAFQQHVNKLENADILTVTGIADASTVDYLLDDKYDKPTADFTQHNPSVDVIVSEDKAKVYSKPIEYEGHLVGYLNKGTLLSMLSDNGTWAIVMNESGNTGYMKLSALTAYTPAPSPSTLPSASPTATLPTFTDVEGEMYVRIATDNAKIYDAPSLTDSRSAAVPKGIEGRLLKIGDEWCYVHFEQQNIQCYVLASDIETFIKEAPTATAQPAPFNYYDIPLSVQVKADKLDIFEQADIASRLLATSAKGTQFTLYGDNGEWGELRDVQGNKGYCLLDGLEAVTETSTQTPTPSPEPTETLPTLTNIETDLYVRVISDTARVYDMPSVTNSQSAPIPKGIEGKVLMAGDEWYYIDFEQHGVQYYALMSDFETFIKEEPTASPEPVVFNYFDIPLSVQVKTDTLDIFEQPDISARRLATTVKGTPFTLYGESGEWGELRDVQGNKGYCLLDGLEAVTDTSTPTPSPEPTATMPAFHDVSGNLTVRATTNGAIAYAFPDVEHNVNMSLSAGYTAQLLRESDMWYEVFDTNNNLTAYVLKNDFEIVTETPKPTATMPVFEDVYSGLVVESKYNGVTAYAFPDVEHDNVIRLDAGYKAVVVQENDMWYGVQDINGGTVFYVLKNDFAPFIATPEPEPTEMPFSAAPNETYAIVTDSNTVFYAEPNEIADMFAVLSKGEVVRVIKYNDKWILAEYGSTSGYILLSSVKAYTPTPVPTTVVTPPPSGEVYTPDWVYDMPSVSAFQQMLVQLGWLDQTLVINGVMDDNVYAAIAEFQDMYNALTPDIPLMSVRSIDGTFVNEYGVYNPIDEQTYKILMFDNMSKNLFQ